MVFTPFVPPGAGLPEYLQPPCQIAEVAEILPFRKYSTNDLRDWLRVLGNFC
jgi:hypothetical protein